ncbi:hypothetical protein EUTSA_v100293321mg, partial [Eutrema salsugineum]
ILSLAELCEVLFPTLKVQTLIVELSLFDLLFLVYQGLQYIIPSDDANMFEELLQKLPTLSNNNNVSIVLKRYN